MHKLTPFTKTKVEQFEKESWFNDLWVNLSDFGIANGTLIFTVGNARKLFDYISRDVKTGQNLQNKFLESALQEQQEGFIEVIKKGDGIVFGTCNDWIKRPELFEELKKKGLI